MGTAITFESILRILLYIAGICALGALAMVLMNVAGIVKDVRKKVEKHDHIIDDTFQKIPTITDNVTVMTSNVSRLTTDASDMVGVVRPEVEKLASTAGGVADTVDNVTRTVDSTINQVGYSADVITSSINNTARLISQNTNTPMDFVYILREVMEALKDVMKR